MVQIGVVSVNRQEEKTALKKCHLIEELRQIIQALEKIRIDEKQKEWIKLILAESFKDEQKYTKERLSSLNAQKNQLRNRIEQLYLDKIDGKISEEFWLSKHTEWSDSLINIQNNITAYEKTNINYLDMSGEFLKICSEITELYKFGTVEGYSFSVTFEIGFCKV